MSEKMNLIDLFAGAGGLSEGFYRNDYNFIAHIEMDKYATETLETRALYHYLLKNNSEDQYYAYLKSELDKKDIIEKSDFNGRIINQEITADTEKPIIRQVIKNMKVMGAEKVDGIIGGPPCQAYSIIGRGRDAECMRDDPRNFLYFHYLSLLNEFQPDFFVFENVPGMISARDGSVFPDFRNRTEKMGYRLYADVINSNDFMVLQSRRRLIVIGYRNCSDFFNIQPKRKTHNFKVNDLLEDLPPLAPGEGNDGVQDYSSPPHEYLIKTGIRTKKDILIHHQARPHIERDREIYRIAIKTWNKHKKRIRYEDLPTKLKTHKNTKIFSDRYKVVAGDLDSSQTIMAHLSKDGHYYIHPDIEQARSLTLREAARLQSFPDNYKFEGPRTSKYWQVGNAVPPLMAESIAEMIKLNFLG